MPDKITTCCCERCGQEESELHKIAGKFVCPACSQTTTPLWPAAFEEHVRQAIKERLDLGHLYDITLEEDGHCASCRPAAAASVWRAVLDAIHDAGWKVVQNV